jgi:hypothetical protein
VSSSFPRSEQIASGLRTAAIFLLAGIAAYAISTGINTTSENTHGISNVVNEATGWNPENNFLRLFVFAMGTAVFFAGLTLLARWRDWAIRVAAVLITATVVIVNKVVNPLAAAPFDFFHYGEQLSPARAVFEGAQPYVDAFVLHGAGEDLLKPIVGFLLFGGAEPNAGSLILISTILRAVAVLGFFAALGAIVRSRTIVLFVLLWFASSTLVDLTYAKTIFYSAFVVLLWAAVERARLPRPRLILLGLAGLVASAALTYSIDVGAMLGLLAAAISIFLVFATVSETGVVALRWPRRWTALIPGLTITAGVLVGQIVFLAVLSPAGYIAFLKATFLEIPRYQGLTWDYPMAGISPGQFNVWIPILVLVILTAMLGDLVVHAWKTDRSISARLGFAIVLWAAALINLRFSVGRPDEGHLYLAGPPIFLAAAYALQLVIERSRAEDWSRAWAVGLVGVLLLGPAGTLDLTRLAIDSTAFENSARALKNFPARPDESWLDDHHRAIVEHIQAETEPGDAIWVMEPEPSLYYFSERENPSRFYISWFVDPEPWTEEVLDDLKANPPELIVYSTGSLYANGDGVPIWDRIPEIDDWVTENYPVRTVVDDAMYLTR